MIYLCISYKSQTTPVVKLEACQIVLGLAGNPCNTVLLPYNLRGSCLQYQSLFNLNNNDVSLANLEVEPLFFSQLDLFFPSQFKGLRLEAQGLPPRCHGAVLPPAFILTKSPQSHSQQSLPCPSFVESNRGQFTRAQSIVMCSPCL